MPFPPQSPYQECLKNQALSLGGYVDDGFCDFLPVGADATLEAFMCAACDCHRNFYRKESFDQIHEPLPIAYRPPTSQYHVQCPVPLEFSGGDKMNHEESVEARKKRFWTKFTTEQKEKMVALAEKMRWKIGRHDEEAVHQICQETSIPMNIFKIWMKQVFP